MEGEKRIPKNKPGISQVDRPFRDFVQSMAAAWRDPKKTEGRFAAVNVVPGLGRGTVKALRLKGKVPTDPKIKAFAKDLFSYFEKKAQSTPGSREHRLGGTLSTWVSSEGQRLNRELGNPAAFAQRLKEMADRDRDAGPVDAMPGDVSKTPVARAGSKPVLREPSPFDPEPFRNYLDAFIAKHDLIDFSEFSVDRAAAESGRKEPLSSVYVELETTGTEEVDAGGSDDEDFDPVMGTPIARAHPPEFDRRRKQVPVSALRAAQLFRHLVLLGDPGAGKSTFVRHLGVEAARSVSTPKVPIFVELRDFAVKFPAADHEPTGALLWRYIQTQDLAGAGFDELADSLEQAVRSGHGVIILDGLDEVKTDASKQFVCAVVADFARAAYAASQIVVTCRTYSYRNQEWSLPAHTGRASFEVVELKPLDRPRIELYLDRLYGRMNDSAKAKAKRGSLLDNLSHHNLERLAGNPLELFNMALLHWHHRLPDNQAALYQQLVELRLFQLHEKRYAKLRQTAPLLDLLAEANHCRQEEFIRSLSTLAYQVHSPERNPKTDQCADISEVELRAALEPLHPVRDKRADWAWRVADEFRQRGGLIREEGRTADNQSVFRFPHRNYQEFLAGRHLARQSAAATKAVGLFRDNAYWRQVVRWIPLIQLHLRDSWPEAIAVIERLFDRTGADWSSVALAADMVGDLGHEQIAQQDSEGARVLETACKALAKLIEAGALDSRTRARMGRFLGHWGDRRSGVGLAKDGLPEIDWLDLPPGSYSLGETKEPVTIKHEFKIGRYPITWKQYQAFVDDTGYQRKEFWDWNKEEAGMEQWWRENKNKGPEDYNVVFQTPNHPRVGVCWYEAAAFCRWLSLKLGLEPTAIRLAHEKEWEWAARCVKPKATAEEKSGRAQVHSSPYPWCGPKKGEDEKQHLSRHCNWGGTGLGHTSAVGLFPDGKANCGAMDMAGNVWEWCDNLFTTGRNSRVLRGGSWASDDPTNLSCSCRCGDRPGGRGRVVGFRCVWVGSSVR